MRLSVVIAVALGIAQQACTPDALHPPGGRAVEFFADGYVDRDRGALIYLRQTLAPNQDYNLDSLDRYAVPSARVWLCGIGRDTCVALDRTAPSTYELATLPDLLGDSVAVRIEVDGEVYTSRGRLPDIGSVGYTPLAAGFIPAQQNADQFFADSYAHDFSLTVSDPSLSVGVTWPQRDGVFGLLLARRSPSACGVLSYKGYDYVIYPTCPLDQTVDFRLYESTEGDFRDEMTFVATASSDTRYLNFLQAYGQDSANDDFAGLYDVILTEGNISGMGGFILFSASRTIRVEL